jgi:hypothetical protein
MVKLKHNLAPRINAPQKIANMNGYGMKLVKVGLHVQRV